MVTIQAAAKCLKAKWSRDLATRHKSRAHGFPGHRRRLATRRVVGQPEAGEPRPTAAGAMGSSSSEGFSCALKSLRVIQVFLKDAEFGKNLANLSNQFAASANRRFEFQKSGQLFIGTHNEAFSIAAMRVCNPDRLPVGINR
jgi:hypothetical protein